MKKVIDFLRRVGMGVVYLFLFVPAFLLDILGEGILGGLQEKLNWKVIEVIIIVLMAPFAFTVEILEWLRPKEEDEDDLHS